MISNGAADDPQFSTIARPGFLTFGQDPNDLTNAAGRLPNDRPHVFRATSVVRLPWSGIQLAANLQTFSGKPWAATTQVSAAARQPKSPAGTAWDTPPLVTVAARRASFENASDWSRGERGC